MCLHQISHRASGHLPAVRRACFCRLTERIELDRPIRYDFDDEPRRHAHLWVRFHKEIRTERAAAGAKEKRTEWILFLCLYMMG